MKRSATQAGVRKPFQKTVVKKKKVFKPSLIVAQDPSRPEMKAVDTNFNLPFGNEDSVSSKIISINQLNQGHEPYERIGRKIRCRMISLRAVVYLDGTIPPIDVLTLYIIYGTRGQPNAFSNIFNGVAFDGVPTGTTSYRPFQMRNLENTDIWKVLWKKQCRITQEDELADNNGQSNNYLIEAHIPCDLITTWDNVPVGPYSGTVVSGGLWFCVQGTTQPISTATMHCQGTCRITYEDC